MMRKIMSVLFVLLFMVSMSGCLSNSVLQDSKGKIALRRAITTNNQAAIQAIRLGDNGAGVGINVLALEALKEQPLKQIGAAIGDALIIWGGYEGIRWAADELSGSSKSGNSQDSGRDSNSIEVNGDGNDIHIGDESSSGVTVD